MELDSTSDFSGTIYKMSWVAYIKPVLIVIILFCIAVSLYRCIDGTLNESHIGNSWDHLNACVLSEFCSPNNVYLGRQNNC